MSTIVLGKRPKTFAPFNVSFEGPDKQEKTIPDVVFKYRTRSEFAKFTDEGNEEAGAAYKIAPGEKFSLEKMFEAQGNSQVKRLMQCIESWGLEGIELNEANMTELQDEYPGAIVALWSAYGNACRDGRLGN
jgi:hypothetical protein